MNNSEFWKSYVAKCSEKGLPPLYENAEEFNKAMTKPPKPYSADDFTPRKEQRTADVGDNRVSGGDADDIEPKKCNNEEIMWELDRMRYEAEETGVNFDDFLKSDVEERKVRKKEVKPNAEFLKKDTPIKSTGIRWFRCESCGEMKDEFSFRQYRNGTFAKVCSACIGSKIREAKADRVKAFARTIEEQKVVLPDSAPLIMSVDPCDGADAIAYGLLHVKEKAPLLKESKPLIAMSEETFASVILLAYTKGKEEAEALDAEEITPAAAESLAMRIILNLKTGE